MIDWSATAAWIALIVSITLSYHTADCFAIGGFDKSRPKSSHTKKR